VAEWSKALAWKVSNIPKGVRGFDKIAWSDFGRRSGIATAPAGRGPGWPESIPAGGVCGLRDESFAEGLWRGGRVVEGARLESE
jgi:hypothetical protein